VAGVIAFEGADAMLGPSALVAVTVKVYEVPRSRPEIAVVALGGLPVTLRPVHPAHAGVGVTVYVLIVTPFSAGAVQLRSTEPSGLPTAVAPLGASGGAEAMVTGFDHGAYAPVPAMLMPATENWDGVS
jgi:hypothetical protein